MKALFSVVLIVILLLLLYAMKYNSASTNIPQPTPAPPQYAAPQAPVPAAQPAMASGAPPQATPSPARNAAGQALYAQVQSEAKKAGVTVLSFNASGQQAQVQVDWIGDVATIGGDFVDQLYKAGIIRTFEEPPNNKNRWIDQQGRSHFTQSFILMLN